MMRHTAILQRVAAICCVLLAMAAGPARAQICKAGQEPHVEWKKWQAEYQTTAGPQAPYDIDYVQLSLAPGEFDLRASASLHFRIPEGQTQFFLRLAPAIDISNLELIAGDGQVITSYQRIADRLFFDLPLTQGEPGWSQRHHITIDYRVDYSRVSPGNFGALFKAPLAFDNRGHFIVRTLSQPFGSAEWWPSRVDMADKIDSLDVEIFPPVITRQGVPVQYKGVSNGLLVGVDTLGGRQRWRYKHRYPIAPYLVFFSVTDYERQEKQVPLSDGFNLRYESFFYSHQASWRQPQDEFTPLVIRIMDSLLGPYPFRRELYGHVQFDFGGGMEHQTRSGMGDINLELVTHELVHQWFGDWVTNASYSHIWLNEGITTFFQSYIFTVPALRQAYPDVRTFANWMEGAQRLVTDVPGGSVYLPSNSGSDRIFDYRYSYLKGAMVTNHLRHWLGEETFFKVLKKYQAQRGRGDGYATTATLKQIINETVNGRSDTVYAPLDQWIYGQGWPKLSIFYNQNSANCFVAHMDQVNSAGDSTWFHLALPVVAKLKDGRRVPLTWRVNGPSVTLMSQLPGQLDSLFIDPEHQYAQQVTQLVQLDAGQFGCKITPSITPNASTDRQRQLLVPDADNSLPFDLTVIDVLGRQVSQQRLYSNQYLDLRGLPQGHYLIRITGPRADHLERISLF